MAAASDPARPDSAGPDPAKTAASTRTADEAAALQAIRSDVLASIRRMVAEDTDGQPSAASGTAPSAHALNGTGNGTHPPADKLHPDLAASPPVSRSANPSVNPPANPSTNPPANPPGGRRKAASAGAAHLASRVSGEKPAEARPPAGRGRTEADKVRAAAVRAAIRTSESKASPAASDSKDGRVTAQDKQQPDCSTGMEDAYFSTKRTSAMIYENPSPTPTDSAPLSSIAPNTAPNADTTGGAVGSAGAIFSATHPADPPVTLFVEMIREVVRKELRDDSGQLSGGLRNMLLNEVARAITGEALSGASHSMGRGPAG